MNDGVAPIEFKNAMGYLFKDNYQNFLYRFNRRMDRGEIVRSGRYQTLNEYFNADIANGNNLSERSEAFGTQLGYTQEHEIKELLYSYGPDYGLEFIASKCRIVEDKKVQADITVGFKGVEYFIELKGYRLYGAGENKPINYVQGASHSTQKARLYLFTGFDVNYNANYVNGEMAIEDLCVSLVDIKNPFKSNRKKNDSRSHYSFSLDKYKNFHFLLGGAFVAKRASKNFTTIGETKYKMKKFPKNYGCSVEEYLSQKELSN